MWHFMSQVSDTHGEVDERLNEIGVEPGDSVIILGDAGINFYLNPEEYERKVALNKRKVFIYCVRGNHEERPENLGFSRTYDSRVDGFVHMEKKLPYIRYLIDGEEYMICGHRTLVLGGAYSVDKFYRLELAEDPNGWTGWFKDEQLSDEEKARIETKCFGKEYSLILSHTCPIGWEPKDLFINYIDQSKIDKSTELWLQKVRENIGWDIWLFGHYHANRFIRPRVEMFFGAFDEIENIYNRWDTYTKTGNFDRGYDRDPYFWSDPDESLYYKEPDTDE